MQLTSTGSRFYWWAIARGASKSSAIHIRSFQRPRIVRLGFSCTGLSSAIRFRSGPDSIDIANLLWRHYRGGLTDSGLEHDPEYLLFHALGLLRLASLHFTKAVSLPALLRVPAAFHLNALYLQRFRKLFAAVQRCTGMLPQPAFSLPPLVPRETASLRRGY